MRRLGALVAGLAFAFIGLASEPDCPNYGSGALEVRLKANHEDPKDKTFTVVIENVGDGLVLIYSKVVPAGCAPLESPYLQMELTLMLPSGEVVQLEAGFLDSEPSTPGEDARAETSLCTCARIASWLSKLGGSVAETDSYCRRGGPSSTVPSAHSGSCPDVESPSHHRPR